MAESPDEPDQRETSAGLSAREMEIQAEFAERREPIIVDPRTLDVLGTVSSFSWEEFYSGPLPSPKQLFEYNEVSPGLGDRIVTEWQMEGSHRRSLEKGVLRGQLLAQSRGQAIATLISLVVIVGGIALLFTDRSIEGLVAVLTPLAVLASAFIVIEIQGKRADSGAAEQRVEDVVQRGSRRQIGRREGQ